MSTTYLKFVLLGVAFGVILSNPHQLYASEQQATPSPRNIPGITIDDPFPSGCVNCHLNYPERNMDTRLSTSLKKWQANVDPKLLEKAQAAAPEGVVLSGRHPSATAALADIPAACMRCHSSMSKKAPKFGQMIHLIHLTGEKDNHFMTIFQGECTYCHKFASITGEWSLPSGPEQ